MSATSVLRSDLVRPDLLEDPEVIKVAQQRAATHFSSLATDQSRSMARSVTPGPAKNIIQIGELIRLAIVDYEARTHSTDDGKIGIVYEKPVKAFDVETISISFAERVPGAFSQGAPREGKVKNLKPILREVEDDPDNPGYKRAVLGYWYDNIIRLTCWARTNKAANERALWLENLMDEYTWYFTITGVNRILYDGWRRNEVLDINNNRYYGRPIDYFVRTEKLWNVSQKKLEEISITVTRSTL